MMEDINPIIEGEKQAEEMMRHLVRHTPEEIQRLRHLLTELEAVRIQEGVLTLVRLQRYNSTDEGYDRIGHTNSIANNSTWRRVQARSYSLRREFKELTLKVFGSTQEKESVEVVRSIDGLRTDFAPVRQVYLVYPDKVVEKEGQKDGEDYTHLTDFYDRLIQLIPVELEVVLFVKTREMATVLRGQGLREKLRCIVHSELESIWLRDFAGFNMSSHLVMPVSYPKRIGTNMKLLHSIIDVDLVHLDLVWDGGNLVTNGHYGFISSKLLSHNPTKSRKDIEQLIESNLGVKPVWVELPAADKLAHTDGYMAFISREKALVSTYGPEWVKKYPKDQQCVDDLARQVQALGIKVERILEYPDFTPSGSPIDSAVGIYVNLLQLNKTWLVPTYGRPNERETLAQLQRLNHGGTIIEIDCTELAKLGGVLHCITFCN